MAISGFVSIPEWGRDSEREGGGAYPARLRPQDAEEVVGKRRRHIWSALSGTQNHPIVSARQIKSQPDFLCRLIVLLFCISLCHAFYCLNLPFVLS